MWIIITIAAAAAIAGLGFLARRYVRMRREVREAWRAVRILEGANTRLGSALFGKDALEQAVLRAKTRRRN